MEIKKSFNNTMEKVGGLCKSKYFNKVIVLMLVFIWTILVFQAGIFVGFKKAAYSFKFADKYYKGFKNTSGDSIHLKDNDMPRSHGAIGKVIEINLPKIIIADRDGIEKTIIVSDDTLIKRFENDASSTEIKINDFAVVIGVPNDDTDIIARLIRLLPPPAVETATSSNK